MKSDAYWKHRQVQDVFHVFQKAEDTADQISKIYLKTSRYLSLQADGIFEKYKAKHGLSEAEARRLINTLQSQASLDELLRKLRNDKQNQSGQDLLSQLEAPAYQARIEHFRQMQNQLDLIMQNVYQQERDFNTSFYTDLANEAYYRSIYNIQQRADAAFSFSHVSAKTIDKVVNSRWSGENYSERIWGNTHSLSEALKEELLINFVTGRTNRDASQIIANKFGQGASISRRLVRTESNYVSTEMNFQAYKECGVEKYQYLATLDLRTSLICRDLDGKIFSVSKRQTGTNCPPMHPWCRSTTISVMDESCIVKMQRSAIDPATGKRIKVPRSMSYWEWYDKYVKGKPEVELEEKKIKNRSSDRVQHQNYRKLLGTDVPKKLDDFQNMKYNDEKWISLHTKYLDAKLKSKIQSDTTCKSIELGKQGKHIIGHNNYVKGRSYLTISLEEVQQLVSKYAGAGELKRDRAGKWTNKEFVSADKKIGVVVDSHTGEEFATSRFSIHYSKKGVHIVPRKEG